MKMFLDNGDLVELPCQDYSKIWKNCFYYGIHECVEDGCPYWKSKDWLCKVMCE